MSASDQAIEITRAIGQFRRSRTRAVLGDLAARLLRRCNHLRRFAESVQPADARRRIDAGYRFVPLCRIVGSVGRAGDFTRDFMPRAGVQQDRWVRVYLTFNSLQGAPDVELIKVGDEYYVEDGNHRVSAARAAGLSEISAHITELASR